MKVLVDTSVWSIVMRRNPVDDHAAIHKKALSELIYDFRALLIGPVRQELLSGISNEQQYISLKNRIAYFEELEIIQEDYEKAAEFFNLCRKKGVQGSHIDFLICAVAHRYKISVYTADKDFENFSAYIPVSLFQK